MFEVYIDLHNQTVYSNIVDKLNKNSIIAFKKFSVLLQFRSSDESLQSAIRLQRHDTGIHRPPVSHLHSLIPQASNQEHIIKIEFSCFVFSIHCRILLVSECRSKKLEHKKKISIFKVIIYL